MQSNSRPGPRIKAFDSPRFLEKCELCPRKCEVNRLAGEKGFCRVGEKALVSHAGLHFGEEPPISGTRGSGTIFFAGCNLACVFCQNHQISQQFDERGVRPVSAAELAAEMLRLEAAGAHNINFVSPSHVVFQMAEAIEKAREGGLTVPVVYNSNGYDSVDSLKRVSGLVDIYLPDLKYLDDGLGARFSKAPDYAGAASEAIAEMFAQAGLLETDQRGVAGRGVLVRHLVLPGFAENTRKCLSFLAGLSREIHLSLMSQYSPLHRAGEHPEIARRLRKDEYDEAVDFAMELGLENVFIQEMKSQDSFLPDFERNEPFSNGLGR